MALLQLPKMTGKGALLPLFKKESLLLVNISGNSTAAAAREGLSPTKDGAVPSVKDADAKDGFMLLQMAGKGDVANGKKVSALLKMVLLVLPMMAGNGPDAPAGKGVTPA